jgi:hypothetical protein
MHWPDGIGLGYSYADVLEMPIDDFYWFNRRLEERMAEIKAHRKSK